MKTKRFHWLMLLSVIILLVSSGFQPARGSARFFTGSGANDLEVLRSSNQGVSFHLQVPWGSLEQEVVSENGTAYTNLHLPGWESMSQSGAPALPYRLVTIGVPFGAEISITFRTGKSHLIKLQEPVLPALSQKVLPDSDFDLTGMELPQVQTQIDVDHAIYGQLENFPGDLARVSNEGVMRGQRLAAIAVYPIQYSPLDNTLTIYDELTVEVQFSGSQPLRSLTLEKDAPVFESMLADTLLNYDQARSWRQPASMEQPASTESLSWDVPASPWKVTVVDEGFYELSKAQLEEEGFPVDTPSPANIQMFNQGQEIALDVRLDTLGTLESILFYGQSIESKYTDQNIYWLTVGDHAGLRIGQRSGAPAGADSPQYHPHELTFESNTFYLANTPGENDLERFFWTYLYTAGQPSLVHTFILENQPYDAGGTMRVDLFGNLAFTQNPDHHVVFYLNEVYLGDTWFDGRTWKHVELTLPPGLLQAGDNTIRLTCPNDTGAGVDLVFVDRIQLEFPDNFTAEEGELTFSYPTHGSWLFEISGIQDGVPMRLFDITNKEQPVEIMDSTIASGILSFEDTLTAPATYRIQKPENYLAAVSIDVDTPSSLKSSVNGADFIIVSHTDFLAAGTTLASYRESAEFRTFTTDVQDVYDEFNYGIISPYAIRDFLAYSQSNWQGTAPAYVLLVGDGNYDPNNYLGFGRTSYIPPFLGMFDPNAGETAADNRYVSFDGPDDQLADMMIGRFSVNTLAEANAMVKKIMAYESLVPGAEDWQHQVLFVADEATLFANTSDYLAENYIEAVDFTATRVYQGVAPHETLTKARAAIQAEINSGKLFVNYIGHAAVSSWGNDSLLTLNDISALVNSYKIPIALAMTCREGYFIYPHPISSNNEALAEVFTRKASGGALASWSSSGVGVATGQFSLNSGFYEAYFYDGVGTLGQAAQAGKLALWQTGYALDLLDTFHLFGDPAIVFKRGLTAVSDDYEVDENDVLTVDAPGVLANDHNPDGLTLSAEIVPDSGPSHGTLDFNPDGSFTYTPEPNWFGLDNFYYRAVEEGGKIQSNPTRVNLVVRSTNQLPVALENTYPAYEDTLLSVSAEDGVLINDTDPDIDTLTAHLYSSPSKGSVILNTDGSFKYYPWYNQNGTDSFTYQAHDGEAFSEAATVTINIAPLNDAPLASDQLVTTVEGTAKEITLIAFDVEGDPLTYSIVAGPTHGTLSGTGFKLTYTPALNYVGDDSFTFKANDGKVDSNIATVSITIIEEPPKNIYLPLILR